ncbi:putative repeat protein (TIGR01451 family), partial [Tenacibaculum lutimaris]
MKYFYAHVLEVYCFVKKNVFSKKKTTKYGFNLQFTILFLLLGVYSTAKLNAQTITLKSSDKLIIDSNKSCNVNPEGPLTTYVAYEFCNTTGLSTAPLEATLSISGANFSLAGGQAITQSLGVLAPGDCATLFWFISYPCTEEVGNVTIGLKDNGNNTISTATSTLSILKGPSANATGLLGGVGLTSSGVGQVTSYNVIYEFGTTDAGELITFQPAGNTDFNAGCFQLVGLEIIRSDIPDVVVGTIDEMVFYLNQAIKGSGNQVEVTYFFKNKCVDANTTASPYAYGVSGTQLKYTGNFDDPTYFGQFPVTENNLSITKTVSTPLVTTAPNTIIYTVAITNSGTSPASIDKITDILPSPLQFNEIDASSDIQANNMSSIPVANATGTLDFVGGNDSTTYPYTEFLIPGNSTVNLVYNVTVPSGITDGDYTNSATFTTGSYTSLPVEATFSFGPIPPVANNDSAVTEEDIPIALNIIANDTDSDGTIDATTVDLDPIALGQQTSYPITGEGTYTVDNSGIVTFTPESGFTGISIINYTVRDNAGNISNEASITIQVGNVCTEDVAGKEFDLQGGNSVTFNQPATNYGFQFDIYTLDNSFNLNINGVNLATQELQFQSLGTSGINVRFQDGDEYETDTSGDIWQMTGGVLNPLIRVVISPSGTVSMFGSKTSGGPLFPLELFGGNTFNIITWNNAGTNTIIGSQTVAGATNMKGYGSGKNIVSCVPNLSLEKVATLADTNGNGTADAGETIDYAFKVINNGNVTVRNIEITDVLPGIVLTGTPIASLVPGASDSTSYSASYTVTQADIDAGTSISNVATATGDSPSGTDDVTDNSDDPTDLTNDDPDNDGDPEDPTDVEVTPNTPNLSLEKRATLNDT